MTDEQKKTIDNLFMRYGSPSREAEIRITEYLIHPQDVNEIKRIEHYDQSTEETIKKLEKAIEKLKVYRIALCEQYNFLTTAPKQKIIKLQRDRSYSDKKVYYYIIEIEKNILNDKEVIISSKKYNGKDRKTAFEDFENYIKEHPDATPIKDIEKKYWEK